MHATSIRLLAQPTITRFGVDQRVAESAVRRILRQFQAEARDPAVARAGRTPDEYLAAALPGPRFPAAVHSTALAFAGREAEAEALWDAHVKEEREAVQRAHLAVPPTALLGNLEAIHNVGTTLSLGPRRTERLVAGIVLTIAAGYKHRPRDMEHLSLTDLLSQVDAEELQTYLLHALLLEDGRREEADALTRAVLRHAD
ncbi:MULTISPECIES: hypothetical protein [unclassified Streptomyces]|uniref:hypothetical protein n=1 Tax=unclassified Streptomyces TaxID=2593676 RepID=UPI001E55A87C|nr:hypothetical protein [Streptomyces sp. CB02980]MCB8906812.1 hypothetical protein [Streptomyces sp. CB02980]